MPRYPSGRICRRCKCTYTPARYTKGQTCPACVAEIHQPRPCAVCGQTFIPHRLSNNAIRCEACRGKELRKCKTCRITLTHEIESLTKGYCQRCEPAPRFCCICGVRLKGGMRCEKCKRLVRKEGVDQGIKHSDFNPIGVDTFFYTKAEEQVRRARRLERLKQIWQARGYS